MKQNKMAVALALLAFFGLFLTADLAVRAQSGPPDLPPTPLAIWTLDNGNWENLWHDPPLGFTNLNLAPSWYGSAVSLDTNVPTFLNVPGYGTDHTNITFDNGAIALWCQPNWTSATDGGTGPQGWAILFQAGRFSTNFLYGCWSLAVSPDGNTLAFITQTNGAGAVQFQTSIDWDAGDWHYVVLDYTPTNCSLFLEGNLVTNLPPIAYWPSYAECSNDGLWIGSDPSGTVQAHAQFQDLETYDVLLSTNLIQWNYALTSGDIVAWGGSVPIVGGLGGHFGDSVPSPGSGTLSSGSTPEFTNPTYTTNSDTAYDFYTNFWLAIAPNSSNTAAVVSLQNTLSNLTYHILTNSVLDPNPADWGVWKTVLASNNAIAVPSYTFTTNSLFWQGRLVWSTTTNGLPDWWQMKYFGNLLQPTNGDYDGNGVTDWQKYEDGTDPNVIQFLISATNQYVNLTNVPLSLAIQGGVPSFGAVLLDTNDFTNATWTAYTSSNLTAHLGTTPGWHTVWVGLRGLPADAQQTWNAICLYLDLTAPTLVITNPVGGTVAQPMIQLQGYANEELAGLRFDLTNALGAVSNQTGFITGTTYNTNTFAYTTNYFHCYDLPLTNGVNTVTLHATDRAGNVTTLTTNFTLSYASRTNPPVVQVYWPQNGARMAGSSFTARGWLNDFTTTISAQITDTNGDTNTVSGVVERNGNFWVDHLPLAAGTNILTLTATDAAGNVTTTNLTLVQSSVSLTVNPVSLSLNQSSATVTGTLNASNYTVWVNGVKATQSGSAPSITWSASNVPLNGAGSLVLQARAIPDSDNSGNGTGGSGGASSSLSNPGNPAAADAWDAEINQDKPAGIYCSYFHFTSWREESFHFSDPSDETDTYTTNAMVDWSGQGGGWEQITDCYYWTAYSASGSWYDFGQGQWDTNGNASGEVGWSEACGVVSNLTAAGPGGPRDLFEGVDGQIMGYAWSGGYISASDTVSHTASTRYTLEGGGRSLPGLQNLFGVAGNALQYTDPWYPEWEANGFYGGFEEGWAIAPAQVQVGGQTENSSGLVYVALPAGESVDVTATTGSAPYYLAQPTATAYNLVIHCEATIPANQSRTTIGVGEYVDLSFSPTLPTNATWSVSAGSLALTNAVTNLFIAPSNATTATLTVTLPGGPANSYPFTVLAPTGVTHVALRMLDYGTNTSPHEFDVGIVGVGMVLTPYFGPTNVSFSRVEGLEVGENATNVTGYYTNSSVAEISHIGQGANLWFSIESDNSWQHLNTNITAWDTCEGGGYPNPGYGGGFTWIIPGQWKVGDSGNTNNLPPAAAWSQTFTLASNGDFTVTKFGWSVTRGTNGAYRTNSVGR